MTRDGAIKQLSKYKKNEELIILWYDKDFFDESVVKYGDKELTQEQWLAVVDKFDGADFEYVLELVMDKIELVATEIMEEN